MICMLSRAMLGNCAPSRFLISKRSRKVRKAIVLYFDEVKQDPDRNGGAQYYHITQT
jgi:hypothetical protein